MAEYGGYDQAWPLEYQASEDSTNPDKKFNEKF